MNVMDANKSSMMSFRKVVPTFRHHALAPTPRNRLLARLALALGAVAAVAGGIALLVWLLAPAAPPPPARTPFGIGVREAAPSAGGLGGYILAVQAQFYRSLQAAVAALKADGAALWSLIALGFAYGVFHAAGPGHGKAVIAAYLVSSERALAKGLGMSLAAALAAGRRCGGPCRHRCSNGARNGRHHERDHPDDRGDELRGRHRARPRAGLAQERQAPRRHRSR